MRRRTTSRWSMNVPFKAIDEETVSRIVAYRDAGKSRSWIALRLGIDRRTVTKNFSPEDKRRINDQRNAYQIRRRNKIKGLNE